jgi:hypothetical protein
MGHKKNGLGHFVVLGEDFNAIMDKLGKGTQPYIRPWIDDLGLAVPVIDILLPTVNYQTHYSRSERTLPELITCFTRALLLPALAAQKSAPVMTLFWMMLTIVQSGLDLAVNVLLLQHKKRKVRKN